MDLLAHALGLALVGAVIFGLGAGLTVLHAFAMRVPLTTWPQPPVPVLTVALPALGWAGFGLYLLALMAADPTAANLWPLTLGLGAILWLAFIAVTAFAATLFRVFLRGA